MNFEIAGPTQHRKKASDQGLSKSWAALEYKEHYKNTVYNIGNFINRNT